jgi:hypothetical protein
MDYRGKGIERMDLDQGIAKEEHPFLVGSNHCLVVEDKRKGHPKNQGEEERNVDREFGGHSSSRQVGVVGMLPPDEDRRSSE